MNLTRPGGFGEENVSVVRVQFDLVCTRGLGALFILRIRITMVGILQWSFQRVRPAFSNRRHKRI